MRIILGILGLIAVVFVEFFIISEKKYKFSKKKIDVYFMKIYIALDFVIIFMFLSGDYLNIKSGSFDYYLTYSLIVIILISQFIYRIIQYIKLKTEKKKH